MNERNLKVFRIKTQSLVSTQPEEVKNPRKLRGEDSYV
jgi:hypothetical protein